MPIYDGQAVSAGITNPAFLDAQEDDIAVGIVGFHNTNPASGSNIDNIQRCTNRLFTATGVNENSNDGTTYGAPTNTITNGQTHQAALTTLANKFHPTTGHTHDGTDGNGGPIPAPSLVNVPLKGYIRQGTTLTAITGTSTDISTQMTGKSVSTGTSVAGVVITSPYNKVELRQATGPDIGDHFVDGSGNIVYGRVTWSAGVWTLSYYVLIGGTPTAYSFTANDIDWYYQELFNPMVNPPVYSEFAQVPSDNATQDVVDATATQRGVVSTSTQSFGGVKTFANTTDSTSSITGAVKVSGGVGIAKKLFVGETINSGTFSGVAKALASDASKNIQEATTTLTELNYVSGVTSSIQTQLNGKEPTITTLPISKGGTNSSTALVNNRIMQSSGGAIVEALAITNDRALVSDANGIPTHSSVTGTELGYLSGVSSAIQTQINSKATDSLVVHLAGTETITGAKTFSSKLNLAETTDAATTGSSAAITPTQAIHRVTNASLVSIATVASPVNGQFLIIENDTGASILVLNETGATATERILTGTGASITLANNASLFLIYSQGLTRWKVIGGTGSGSGTSATYTILAGETLVAGEAVYISSSSDTGGRTLGSAYKLDATNANRMEYAGIVTTGASAGNSATITIAGRVTGLSSLTTGQPVFASTSTPGAFQTAVPSTAGQYIIQIGVADTSTSLIINASLSATATLVTMPSTSLLNTWTTGTNYSVNNVVMKDGYMIKCLTNHTSGTYATDLASGYWQMASQMRNFAYNSAFDIWQRGTSFTHSGGAKQYSADRFQIWEGSSGVSGSFTQQVSTGGIGYALRIGRISGTQATTGNIQVLQHFETADIKKFVGKQVSMSFLIKNVGGFTGTLSGNIISGTGPDTNNAIYSGFTAAVNVASTGNFVVSGSQTKKVISGVVPSNTTQLAIYFYLATPSGVVPANDFVEIEQVMFNEGPAPSSFQTAGDNIQDELAMCQRYYQRIGDKVNNAIQYFAYGQTGQNNVVVLPLKVVMRGTPNAAVVGTWTTQNCSQPALTGVSADNLHIYAATTATGMMGFYNATASTQYVTADAEL